MPVQQYDRKARAGRPPNIHQLVVVVCLTHAAVMYTGKGKHVCRYLYNIAICPPSPLKKPTWLNKHTKTLKNVEMLPVNVAADVDVPPQHDEYVRTCLLVSLTMIFAHVLGLSSPLFCSSWYII